MNCKEHKKSWKQNGGELTLIRGWMMFCGHMMKLGLVMLVAHSAALDVVRSRGAPPGQRVTAPSLEDLTAVRPGSCSQHSRRRLVSCAVPIGLFITSRPAAAFAADELPAEATFLVPTPLGIISYGLKKQSQRQGMA